MKRPRDLSYKQFLDAITRNGMRLSGFMGYVDVGQGKYNLSVSYFNAPLSTWRSRLAYLLRKQKENMERAEREEDVTH